jgi:hypothetical protein
MHKSAIALSLLFIAGCTRTNAALLDQTTSYPKTCERGVLMYTQPSKAPAGYKELALLNATGSSSWTSEGGMMKSMRKKAADLGATGIILGNIDEPGAGAKVAAAVLGVGADRKGKAVAIYADADTTRVWAACAQ